MESVHEEKWEMKNGKGKGVCDNGKRSNLQILSQTTPFPVQNDSVATAINFRCDILSEYSAQQMPFLGWPSAACWKSTVLTDS